MSRVLNDINDVYFDDPFINKVAEHADDYSVDDLYLYSQALSTKRFKLLRYVMLKEGLLGEEYEFKMDLLEADMYERFFKNVMFGNDEFIRAFFVTYLEPEMLEEEYDENDIIELASESKEYNIRYRLGLLVKYTCYNLLDKEKISKLKDAIRNIILCDEASKLYSKEEIDKMIEYYDETIDELEEVLDYKLALENGEN